MASREDDGGEAERFVRKKRRCCIRAQLGEDHPQTREGFLSGTDAARNGPAAMGRMSIG